MLMEWGRVELNCYRESVCKMMPGFIKVEINYSFWLSIFILWANRQYLWKGLNSGNQYEMDKYVKIVTAILKMKGCNKNSKPRTLAVVNSGTINN